MGSPERRASRGAFGAVGAIELEAHARRRGQNLPEYRAREHVLTPRTNDRRTHAELPENFHPVLKREGDTLLDAAREVRVPVSVEIEMGQGRTHLSIPEHALDTITEGEKTETLATNRDCGRSLVHLLIVRFEPFAQPTISTPRPVDAEQNPEPRIFY